MLQNAILAIFGAVLTYLCSRILSKQKRSEEKSEKREQDRDEREELILQCIDAQFSITKELVDCVLYDKKPNGELEEAFKYKQDVKHKMEDYMRKRAARQ